MLPGVTSASLPVGSKESNMPFASIVPVLVKLVPLSEVGACGGQ